MYFVFHFMLYAVIFKLYKKKEALNGFPFNASSFIMIHLSINLRTKVQRLKIRWS